MEVRFFQLMDLQNVNYISLSHTVNRSSRQALEQYIKLKGIQILGFRQAVRQRSLTPSFNGSNPLTPASCYGF